MWDRSRGLRDLGIPVCYGSCDINNAEQIAATAVKTDNEAFVMDPNGAVQFLGSLGGQVSEARAINDRGQVVGRSAYASGRRGYEGTHAFLWDPNEGMTDLGTVGGLDSEATAISEAGEVFGFFEYSGQGMQRRRRPCYWDPADAFSATGTEPASDDYFAMNGQGWLVGKHTFMKDGSYVVLWREYGGIRRLFPYDPDMDVQNGATWLINDANQVVYSEEYHSRWERYSPRLFPPRQLCVLWDRERGFVTLDRYLPSGTERFEARDLNNHGAVLGLAHLKGGHQVPVLLEPISEEWGDPGR